MGHDDLKLGNELKVERIRLQMKAKDMAERIAVSPQLLYKAEQNEGETTVIKYLSFLRSQGVDINKLFDRIENSKTNKE